MLEEFIKGQLDGMMAASLLKYSRWRNERGELEIEVGRHYIEDDWDEGFAQFYIILRILDYHFENTYRQKLGGRFSDDIAFHGAIGDGLTSKDLRIPVDTAVNWIKHTLERVDRECR